MISRYKDRERGREGDYVEQRLLAVYKFAGEQIIGAKGDKSCCHIDIGTYNGFAQKRISTFAEKIYTLDIDYQRLTTQAARNSWIQNYRGKKVELFNMAAQRLAFADNTFESLTCVEVFGAGFEGTHDEVRHVFEEMSRVLKPGGIAIFTLKSPTMDTLLSGISGFSRDKGYPVNRDSIQDILDKSFGSMSWYGQMPVSYNATSRSIQLPLTLAQTRTLKPQSNEDDFKIFSSNDPITQNTIDRFKNGEISWPRYWVCVAKKN